MSYFASNGLGLQRTARRVSMTPRSILNLRTYANVYRDPKPTGMGYIQPPDCTADLLAGGNAIACVEEMARIQQLNMAERNADQRAIFLANCNRDWELNDQQYAALGLPRPVNTCDQRSFGITPMGETGSPVETPIPVTYLPPPPAPVSTSTQQAATSAAPSQAAAPPPPVPAATNSPAPTVNSGGYVPSSIEEVKEVVSDIPMWALIALAGGALLVFGGRR